MSDTRAKPRGYGLAVRNSLQLSKRISRVFVFNERIIAYSLIEEHKHFTMASDPEYQTKSGLDSTDCSSWMPVIG